MTSLFDGGRVARLRNVRLSDDRPIRQFFLRVAEAYTIGQFEKRLLAFLIFLRSVRSLCNTNLRRRLLQLKRVSPDFRGCRVQMFQVRSTYVATIELSFRRTVTI